MKVAIHQPEHLPWLGFFHKVNMADVFVVLDNVQYRRRYFQNRNKIRTKDDWQWVIVPLKKAKRDELLIKDAKISKGDMRWKEKNLRAISRSYSKADYFKKYWDEFEEIYRQNFTHISDLNIALLKFIFNKLGIRVQVQLASDMDVCGQKSDLILNICEVVGATNYISGISGRDYLDIDKFKRSQIKVTIQEFHHPIYRQLFEPFIPCMSIIDLLFNHGDKSLNIINGLDTPVMEELFL